MCLKDVIRVGRSLPTPKTMRGGTSSGHVSAPRNTVCTVSTTVAFASRCIVCVRCDGMYQIIYLITTSDSICRTTRIIIWRTTLYMAQHTHKHAHTSTQTGTDMTCSTERKGWGGREQQEGSKAQRPRHAAKVQAAAKAGSKG